MKTEVNLIFSPYHATGKTTNPIAIPTPTPHRPWLKPFPILSPAPPVFRVSAILMEPSANHPHPASYVPGLPALYHHQNYLQPTIFPPSTSSWAVRLNSCACVPFSCVQKRGGTQLRFSKADALEKADAAVDEEEEEGRSRRKRRRRRRRR